MPESSCHFSGFSWYFVPKDVFNNLSKCLTGWLWFHWAYCTTFPILACVVERLDVLLLQTDMLIECCMSSAVCPRQSPQSTVHISSTNNRLETWSAGDMLQGGRVSSHAEQCKGCKQSKPPTFSGRSLLTSLFWASVWDWLLNQPVGLWVCVQVHVQVSLIRKASHTAAGSTYSCMFSLNRFSEAHSMAIWIWSELSTS